jgi:hypothetical protein
MVISLATSALLILLVVATRVIQPVGRAQASREDRRQPPQPRPGLIARPTTVRPRHDHRDGGRGRLRPRRRSTRR